MSTPYTGALSQKRRPELVEIAQALELDASAKMADLVKSIQNHLDTNEDTLSKSPMFKGLYSRRRNHTESDADTPSAEHRSVGRPRKSINKVLDKVINAADVPLPESPVSVQKIAADANQQLQVALAPAKDLSHSLTTHFDKYSKTLVKYGHQGQQRVDTVVRAIRNSLSTPEHIIVAAISLELVALFFHVVQFYDHTIWFPPPSGSKGTISSLLHSAFSWAPQVQLNVRWADVHSFRRSGEIYNAVVWWFFSTVLPPLAASTLVSFVPQKGPARPHATRHAPAHPATPTMDPLAFSIFRLALLVFPLTTAAPSAMVDALEMSGNLQGRVLGAALLAGLMLADRLGSL